MKINILTFLVVPIFFACGSNSADETNEQSSDSINVELEEEVLEIDIHLNKVAEIPADCKFEGKKIDAYSWVDKNGINYFIRTIGDLIEAEPEDEYADVTASQHLYAYHYTKLDSKADAVLLKETTDFIKDCEFDVNVTHELDALTLTDIDKNEVGEITFIYRTTCTSDVSPSTQKLIMLENGQKYPLRGETKVMEVGGEFTVGDEFKTAPEGFQAHAEKLWSEHLVEFDFEL